MNTFDIDAIVNSAVFHQKCGRKDSAEKLFQQALALQPEHCAALHFLGLLCQQRGNDAAALDFLRRSVMAAPGSEQAHYHNNLATGFGRAGRLDEALKAIERALFLKPDYAEAWGNKGVVLEKQGKLEESRQALAKAVELKSDFIDAQINLGNILAKMGKDKEAMEHLEQAAERFPKEATLAINLGNALRRCGRIDAAIASLRRAVERRPSSPEARNNLGVALHDAGMLADAEAELRKSIDLRSNYADAHWNLSLVLLHKGDFHNGWMEYGMSRTTCGSAKRVKSRGAVLSNWPAVSAITTTAAARSSCKSTIWPARRLSKRSRMPRRHRRCSRCDQSRPRKSEA